jgi:hypothetical protein
MAAERHDGHDRHAVLERKARVAAAWTEDHLALHRERATRVEVAARKDEDVMPARERAARGVGVCAHCAGLAADPADHGRGHEEIVQHPDHAALDVR